MLTISKILGELIKDYYELALNNNRESRIVIPGLTNTISREIHYYLKMNGINSYLIIGNEMEPSEEESYLRAAGLTSKRISSFVAIACPGQLTHIQDSIRGSGGAIRSTTFSEEWPWIDNGSEAFRFQDSFLFKLVQLWTSNIEEQKWLIDFILKILVPSTRASSLRTQLLLEEILGNFSDTLYPEIPDVRLKMIYHSGIPRPNTGIPPVDLLLRDSMGLCKKIYEKYQKEDNIRRKVIDVARRHYNNDEIDLFIESINVFFDGLGQSKTKDLGALAFFSCWGTNPEHWSRLDATNLERLFELQYEDPVEVTYKVECNRCIKSSTDDIIVTFHGETLFFSGSYFLNHLMDHLWQIRLMYRNSILYSQELSATEGDYSFIINTDIFKNYRSGLLLKLVLVADDKIRAEARIKLHLCGEKRPALALLDPGFEVINANIQHEDELIDKKINTDEAVHIYMFSYEGEEPRLLDSDENELPTIETGKLRIWRSGDKLDPAKDAIGQIVRKCQFGDLFCVICLEAQTIDKGEFTIEDELRVSVADEKISRVKELLDIFDGKQKIPFRRLGKIYESSLRRIFFANIFTSEIGWKPILVDMQKTDYHDSGVIGDYLAFCGEVEAVAFNRIVLPEQARELIKKYSSVRSELIKIIRERHELDLAIEHPLYATHPIYVNNDSSETETIIIHYLKSYIEILNYIKEEGQTLEWSQIFILVYLDCIVNWDNGSLKNSIVLVGPWHPLVFAKRYMVQCTLYNRAQEMVNNRGAAFNKLAVLLKEINGFRWLPGLNKNDRTLDSFYVVPTSDPGWHLAAKPEVVINSKNSGTDDYMRIKQIIANFGVESSFSNEFSEDIARSGLTSFMRAFPNRRSLIAKAQKGFKASVMISSIDQLLHNNEGATEVGLQLPGGVHLFIDDYIEPEVDINLKEPPIVVYGVEDIEDCFKGGKPDVCFVSPEQKVSFQSGNSELSLPRGLNNHAVFYQALCCLTEGQALLPNSISFEVDREQPILNDLSNTFIRATTIACSVLKNHSVMVRSVELPQVIESPWIIVPGGGIDPAIFVKYVRDGSDRAIQDRVLWDYRYNITSSKNTYYILSTVPKGFDIIVNGFFSGQDVASSFVQELGLYGISIGGEALKSGRNALGVIGLVGAIRLIQGIGGSGKGIFHSSPNRIGFIIPVDAFTSFFGNESAVNGDAKRTDLLAIEIILPLNDESNLSISAVGVESKFVSGTFAQPQAIDALSQAQASLDQFRLLVNTSLENWALPERLGLLAIINFGLRIVSPSNQAQIPYWMKVEQLVYDAILKGRYEYNNAKCDAIVVSTEGNLIGVAEDRNFTTGMWIRINKENWPGISDTEHLELIRNKISLLFTEPEWSDLISDESSDNKPNFGQEEAVVDTSTLINNNQNIPNDQIVNNEQIVDIDPGSDTSDDAICVENEHIRKILIGVDDARRPIYFDPQSPVDPLDNINIMVTGSSGTGKTQLLKYLICKIREQGKNVLILDFKKDFIDDSVFCDLASLHRVAVNFDGLPFNPLIPYPIQHPISGELMIQSGQHISGVVSVLKRTYGLGAQQQAYVKRAISQAFDNMQIPSVGTAEYNTAMRFPDFSSIGDVLEATNLAAYNRLDPLFTLDLFRPQYKDESFQSLINKSTVLDLSQLPSDELKNTLAELVVLSAHNYFNAQQHSGIIRQMLVFDEAHRLLGSDFLTRIIRECRAYGVGVILSSQYPDDFPAQVSGSMATKLLHGNGRDIERVRDIIQLIGCSGREVEVAGLDRFQAFLDNRHYPHTLIRTMNYPALLAYSYILNNNEVLREDLKNINGLDNNKLPISNIVKHLEKLGLIEEKEGRIKPITKH